jgi:hypothetical protein
MFTKRLAGSAGVLTAFAAAAIAAAPVPPKTVLDYFLLLPNKYFEIGRRERMRWLKDTHSIVDTRHGYLRMYGDGAQAELELCLFRKAGGSYLIGVAGNLASDGGWDPWLDLYTYRNGHFVDVEKQMLPIRFPAAAGYRLPRYGRTILVRTAAGRVLYRCTWTGTRFAVEKTGAAGRLHRSRTGAHA